MQFTTVDEYNNYLINNKMNAKLTEYVKSVNEIRHNIDIDFINLLLEFIVKDECCIHHDILIKCNVLPLEAKSKDIKGIIDQFNLINKQDWLLTKVCEKNEGKIKYKYDYYFHPDAFKLCLMKSSVSLTKYMNFFIVLEKYIRYYNSYSIKFDELYIAQLNQTLEKKDKKICSLEKKKMPYHKQLKNLFLK